MISTKKERIIEKLRSMRDELLMNFEDQNDLGRDLLGRSRSIKSRGSIERDCFGRKISVKEI